jgi:hypothetical protein
MVKVTGPALSLSAYGPLRKPRRLYGAAPLPPYPEQIVVTAGDPAPDPDCTGIYAHFAEYQEHHAYRRKTLPYFYLFCEFGLGQWEIGDGFGEESSTIYWYNTEGPAGPYEPCIPPTGIPIASEPFIP